MKFFDYKDKRGESNGAGIISVLTLIFVVLKLVHVINWSWWWVLSPLWISAIFGIIVLIVAGLIMLIAVIVKSL